MQKTPLLFNLFFFPIFMLFGLNCLAAEGYFAESDLHILGDTITYNRNSNTLTVTKNVKVKSPNFYLTSNKMVALYEDGAKVESMIPSSEEIKELVATGNVVIQMSNGYITFSDKAEYYKKTRTIILSGNPRIRSDANEVKGCIIKYFLDKGSYTIESCPESTPSAVLTK